MQDSLIIKLLLLLFSVVITSSAQLRRDHKKSNLNRNSIKYDYTNNGKLDDDFNKCKRTSSEGLSQRSTSPRIPLYALQSEFNYDTSEVTNSVQNETNNEEFRGRKPFKVASEMKIEPLIGETNLPPNVPRKTDRRFPLNPSNKNKSVDNAHLNEEFCDDLYIKEERNLDEIKTNAGKNIINLFRDNSDDGIDLNVNELDYNKPSKNVRLSGVNTLSKLGGVKKLHNKLFKDVNMSLKSKLHESTDNPIPLKAESENNFISHNCRNDAFHDVGLQQLHNMKIVHSYYPQIDDIGGSNETTTHDDGDVTTSGNLEKTTSNIVMDDLYESDYPSINSNKSKKKNNFAYKDLNCVLKTNLDNNESILYCYTKRPMEDRILTPNVMIGMPMPFEMPMPELPPVRPQLRQIAQVKPLVFFNARPPNPANIVLQPPPVNPLRLNNIGFMML